MIRRIARLVASAAAILVLLFSAQLVSAQAVPTRIIVRAVSQDAKIIGDGVGGARITIVDASTGDTLASGLQAGGTGDTDAIMKTPRERHGTVYGTTGAAGYEAILKLDRPTQVEIIAEGPLKFPQAVQKASATMLVVPGKDVVGEGVVLTLHGFIVDIMPPEGHFGAGSTIPIRAMVTMACGCPTQPGGLWDADAIEIVARVWSGKRLAAEAPMRYDGTASRYAADLEVPGDATGPLRLEVVASDSDQANFGQDSMWITARL